MEDIRKGICPLCRHNEIIQAAPVEGDYERANPLAVTHEKSWFRPLGRAIGPLNTFVCRRCGFAQWFAFDMEKIPIGDEFGTRLIRGPEDAGPYR